MAIKQRWIYRFDQLPSVEQRCDGWDDVKALLGGKGANLADMTRLGLPVPPGFIVTSAACRAYLAAGALPREVWDQALVALGDLGSAPSSRPPARASATASASAPRS